MAGFGNPTKTQKRKAMGPSSQCKAGMQATQQNNPSPGYLADAYILFNHVIAVMNLNMKLNKKFRLKCVLKIILNYVSM